MPTLFDLINQAQNGEGMAMLARQFGLSQSQAQQAVEALLPAFSQGLKRNAADPYGIGAFMTALASGQHAQYFDNPAAAFSPQGMSAGNDLLGQLFGSKDLSRAVADQAAQATGIGQDILKQMLPAIASMLMGGMSKQSTSQMPGQSFGAAGNPLQEIIEQMMKQGMGGAQQRQAPQPEPQQNPFGDNPFGKVLQDMFGGAAAQAPQQRQNPAGNNPWGQILEDMLRGGQQAPAADDEPPARRPQADPSGRQRNPYDDIFGDMFETGRKQRDDYQKGMESIFDQFTRGMDRYK